MSTLSQIKEGLQDAWDSLTDGWQRLYRRAAGAITRYTGGARGDAEDAQAMATRNAGWGVLAGEVYDDDDRVVVRLEAPGMESDDFDLQVIDDYLVVRGEKHISRDRKVGHYHVTERAYGRFERAVPLPATVDEDGAKASYRRGVLEIELPKRSTTQRRRIEVVRD